MAARVTIAFFEWAAGLLIGIIPLLWHVMALWTGHATPMDAWATDTLLVAITTSGLTTLTVFTRFAKGAIQSQHLGPHSYFVMAVATVSFVLSAMLFGQVTTGGAVRMPLGPPLAFLLSSCCSSLYFEILLAIAQSRGGPDRV